MIPQIKIDFFSTDDLRTILDLIKKGEVEKKPEEMMLKHFPDAVAEVPLDDRTKEEIKKEDDADLYNISSFSI
jgi:hypothetical protein